MAGQDDFKLAPLIGRLEQLFKAGEMKDYGTKLAAFKAGYISQQKKLATMRDPPWTSETLIEFASVFQVEPFAERYPLAPNDGRCPMCRAETAGKRSAPVLRVFVDRNLHACRKCGARFVRMSKTSRGA